MRVDGRTPVWSLKADVSLLHPGSKLRKICTLGWCPNRAGIITSVLSSHPHANFLETIPYHIVWTRVEIEMFCFFFFPSSTTYIAHNKWKWSKMTLKSRRQKKAQLQLITVDYFSMYHQPASWSRQAPPHNLGWIPPSGRCCSSSGMSHSSREDI